VPWCFWSPSHRARNWIRNHRRPKTYTIADSCVASNGERIAKEVVAPVHFSKGRRLRPTAHVIDELIDSYPNEA
jgi:hypothetical protein